MRRTNYTNYNRRRSMIESRRRRLRESFEVITNTDDPNVDMVIDNETGKIVYDGIIDILEKNGYNIDYDQTSYNRIRSVKEAYDKYDYLSANGWITTDDGAIEIGIFGYKFVEVGSTHNQYYQYDISDEEWFKNYFVTYDYTRGFSDSVLNEIKNFVRSFGWDCGYYTPLN